MKLDIKPLLLANKSRNKISYSKLLKKIDKCRIFELDKKEFKTIKELMEYKPKSMNLQDKGKML